MILSILLILPDCRHKFYLMTFIDSYQQMTTIHTLNSF